MPLVAGPSVERSRRTEIECTVANFRQLTLSRGLYTGAVSD